MGAPCRDDCVNAIDLTGKVAVVTGGSRGLGLAIVRGLSGAGATVAIASRKLEACKAVVNDTAKRGPKSDSLLKTRSSGREPFYECN